MPLPSEDTTPPVTKTNLVIACSTRMAANAVVVKREYIGGGLAARAAERHPGRTQTRSRLRYDRRACTRCLPPALRVAG